MTTSKCANPECQVTWESKEEDEFKYCSFECAVYDGVFSVRTGWNEEKLQQKRQLKGVSSNGLGN